MAAWLLRVDVDRHHTIKVSFSEADPSVPRHVEFDAHLWKPPTLRVGDHIVFARERSSDLAFFGHAVVSGIEYPPPDETKAARDRRTPPVIVTLGPFASFPEDRLLSVFAFSLSVVYRLDDPLRHFRRAVRRLSDRDVETLASGKIYVARTAFYSLYSALPPRVRRDFELFALNLGRRLHLSSSNVSDRDRFGILAEYLREELKPKLKLLMAMRAAYDAIQCDDKPPYEALESESVFDEDEEHGAGHVRRLGRATAGALDVFKHEDAIEALADAMRTGSDAPFEEARWTPLI